MATSKHQQHTALAKHIGELLFARLDYMRLQPRVILDLGSGTGYFTKRLQKRYRNATVLALDSVQQQLKYAKWRAWFNKPSTVCADAHYLPFANHSVDLLFANLLLPWCDDIPTVLAEIQRVLTPQGLLLFSTLGPDSFKELITASHAMGVTLELQQCIDMHHLGDLLVQTHLADPVTDRQVFTATYQQINDLLSDVNLLVNNNTLAGLCSQQTELAQQYQALVSREPLLSLTLEVIFANAWGSQVAGGNRPQPSGEVDIPLSSIGRHLTVKRTPIS